MFYLGFVNNIVLGQLWDFYIRPKEVTIWFGFNSQRKHRIDRYEGCRKEKRIEKEKEKERNT